MELEEETQQKLEISFVKTKGKGKFPFVTSEIIGNCAFHLSLLGENSHEILIFFAVNWLIELSPRKNVEPRIVGLCSTFRGSTFFRLVEIRLNHNIDNQIHLLVSFLVRN